MSIPSPPLNQSIPQVSQNSEVPPVPSVPIVSSNPSIPPVPIPSTIPSVPPAPFTDGSVFSACHIADPDPPVLTGDHSFLLPGIV